MNEEPAAGHEGSDDSNGYHSDEANSTECDSTVMVSGNSPFVPKSARYNFLQRSGECAVTINAAAICSFGIQYLMVTVTVMGKQSKPLGGQHGRHEDPLGLHTGSLS